MKRVMILLVAAVAAFAVGMNPAFAETDSSQTFSATAAGAFTSATSSCFSNFPSQTCTVTWEGAGPVTVGATTIPGVFHRETDTILFGTSAGSSNGQPCFPMYATVTVGSVISLTKFEVGRTCGSGFVYDTTGFFVITGGTGAWAGARGAGTFDTTSHFGTFSSTENGRVSFGGSGGE